mmetsp:Transcript_33201/g.80274  ORF Transcript_33201/g.80274 Transcript_33201/m.80274 type:complete len:85 (+) Transcript_33201:1783-2037(+)
MIFGKYCGRTYGVNHTARVNLVVCLVESGALELSCLACPTALSVYHALVYSMCTLLENLQIQASRAVSMEKGIKDHQVESSTAR